MTVHAPENLIQAVASQLTVPAPATLRSVNTSTLHIPQRLPPGISQNLNGHSMRFIFLFSYLRKTTPNIL